MRRTTASALLATLAFLSLAAAANAHAPDIRLGHVEVYTRNLYLGADLAPVIRSASAAEFLANAQAALGQIAANNFPVRAAALAHEIAVHPPDLMGLQEVFRFTVDPGTPES
jgi:hypothetical protein